MVADWVQNHIKRELTPFQRGAVELICEAMRCGPYDFAKTFERANWYHGLGVSFVIYGDLATFDSNGLTRLVIGAHDRCFRVDIEGCGPKRMRVSIWPREGREGPLHRRHPTIEQAIEHYRGAWRGDQS